MIKKTIQNINSSFELGSAYRMWHILSWIFLIFGYSLIMVNTILFADDPQLLFQLGVLFLKLTLVNFYLIGTNVLILAFLIIKEDSWYYYREYFWGSVAYLTVSFILLQATLMN